MHGSVVYPHVASCPFRLQVASGSQDISCIGIHTLLLCVTRGYGYHSPLTSDAGLEEERRSEPERAAVARRGRRGGDRGRLGGDGKCCLKPNSVIHIISFIGSLNAGRYTPLEWSCLLCRAIRF